VKSDLLVLSAAQLITAPAGAAPLVGQALGRPLLYSDAAIAVVGETIAAVGPTREVTSRYPEREAKSVLDARGRLVAPGFVDAHTHLPFAGTREMEFEARAAGRYRRRGARGGIRRRPPTSRSRGELGSGCETTEAAPPARDHHRGGEERVASRSRPR
jgi:predicted amidohydrolase YtcJ